MASPFVMHGARDAVSRGFVHIEQNGAFNDSMDEAHGMIRIYDVDFRSSEVLFQMEPETYRVYLAEFDGQGQGGNGLAPEDGATSPGQRTPA